MQYMTRSYFASLEEITNLTPQNLSGFFVNSNAKSGIIPQCNMHLCHLQYAI